MEQMDDGQKFQTDRRKEMDRNDETCERWKTDKNFRGQKTDKISNRKDRERDRTGKISKSTKNTQLLAPPTLQVTLPLHLASSMLMLAPLLMPTLCSRL